MFKLVIILIISLNCLSSNDTFLDFQVKRVYKKLIDSRINKINIINNYINIYILRHGRIKPNQDDLENLNDELVSFWPKGIDNSKDIEFYIDNENMNIKYTNIFKNSTKDYINSLMKNSVYLNSNSYITSSNEIVILFSSDVSNLIDRLNKIDKLGEYGSGLREGTSSSKCDLDNSTFSENTVYISNGSKEFELKYCDTNHIKFDYLPLNIYNYTDDIDSFESSYITQSVYEELNSTSVKLNIFNGTNFLRIKK